jgi:hypothetical protein
VDTSYRNAYFKKFFYLCGLCKRDVGGSIYIIYTKYLHIDLTPSPSPKERGETASKVVGAGLKPAPTSPSPVERGAGG